MRRSRVASKEAEPASPHFLLFLCLFLQGEDGGRGGGRGGGGGGGGRRRRTGSEGEDGAASWGSGCQSSGLNCLAVLLLQVDMDEDTEYEEEEEIPEGEDGQSRVCSGDDEDDDEGPSSHQLFITYIVLFLSLISSCSGDSVTHSDPPAHPTPPLAPAPLRRRSPVEDG